jgi:hypothetical protein
VFNNSILYPCALDGESKLVHIKDATSGPFTCLNPECGGDMVARQGDVRIWHFAHKLSSVVCSGETALHFTAKMLLEQSFRDGTFPAIYYPCPTCGYEQLLSAADCGRLSVEAFIYGVRPDIAMFVGDRVKFVIEVVVAHSIEPKTLAVYRVSRTAVVVWEPSWDELRSGLKVIRATRTHGLGSSRCRSCVRRGAAVDLALDASVTNPRSVLDFAICDHDNRPVPDWTTCRPCSKFKDGHCNSVSAQFYQSWKLVQGVT